MIKRKPMAALWRAGPCVIHPRHDRRQTMITQYNESQLDHSAEGSYSQQGAVWRHTPTRCTTRTATPRFFRRCGGSIETATSSSSRTRTPRYCASRQIRSSESLVRISRTKNTRVLTLSRPSLRLGSAPSFTKEIPPSQDSLGGISCFIYSQRRIISCYGRI